MLLRAYEFSATIHDDDMDKMQAYLRGCDAFGEPATGKLKFLKKKD
jgi:hypothetical protein